MGRSGVQGAAGTLGRGAWPQLVGSPGQGRLVTQQAIYRGQLWGSVLGHPRSPPARASADARPWGHGRGDESTRAVLGSGARCRARESVFKWQSVIKLLSYEVISVITPQPHAFPHFF